MHMAVHVSVGLLGSGGKMRTSSNGLTSFLFPFRQHSHPEQIPVDVFQCKTLECLSPELNLVQSVTWGPGGEQAGPQVIEANRAMV